MWSTWGCCLRPRRAGRRRGGRLGPRRRDRGAGDRQPAGHGLSRREAALGLLAATACFSWVGLPGANLGGVTGRGLGRTNALHRRYRPMRDQRSSDFDPDCADATWSDFAASESTRKPLLHTRGICRARSFDLEVTRWAPTRLTSCIFHPGPEESSGAPTLAQAAQVRPGAISPPRNRPASPQASAAH